MKRRISALLLAAVMLITGASCGDGDSSSKTGSSRADSSSAAETTSSSSPKDDSSEASSTPEADPSQAEPEPVFPPMSSAAQELTCLKASGKAMNIVSSANNKLAVSCISPKGTGISTVDPVEDKLLGSFDIKYDGEMLIGMRPDNTVITSSPEDKKILFYDENSSTPREIEYPNNVLDLHYDPVTDTLFAYQRNIVSIDMQTGETKELVATDEITDTITAVNFGRGIYTADRKSTDLGGSLKSELFKLDSTGSISSLPVYNCDHCFFLKDYTVCETYGEDLLLSLFDPSDGSHVSTFVSPIDSAVLTSSEFSNSILSAASNIDGDTWETYIKVVDFRKAELGEIHFENNMLYGLTFCASPSGRWFLAVTRGEGDGQQTNLIMADPSQAENRTAVETAALPACSEAKHHEIDSYFSDLRAKLDKLEEKYGVRLLICEEALDLPADTDYDYDILTKNNYNLEDSEVTVETLEEILSLYPKDFFKKFVSSAGGGLRIALVNKIIRKDTSIRELSPTGLTWETGAWINIAVNDPDMYFDKSILHHEIWHAVEFLVDRSDPIDEDKWSELNPKDFSYGYDFTAYMDGAIDNTYTLEGEGEHFFISTYSMVNSHEDRATVIQRAMTDEDNPSEERLSNYPRLKAKADFIAEWIRPYFGYVYFEDRINGSRAAA